MHSNQAIEKMQKGDIVLITGGSSGVGLQLAKELAQNGCKVLICGRSIEKLQQAQKEIPEITKGSLNAEDVQKDFLRREDSISI